VRAAGAVARRADGSISSLTGGPISLAMRRRLRRRLWTLALAGERGRSWTSGAWLGGMTSRSALNTRKGSPSCFMPILVRTRCCQKPPAGREPGGRHADEWGRAGRAAPGEREFCR
jgi:hypothetical protein